VFRLFESIPRGDPHGLKALLACVPGEEHDVGLQIASGYLEAMGWDVTYVGRSAPEREIMNVIEDQHPRIAVFSVSLIARLPAARDLFLAIRERFPGVKLIAGGRAASAARAHLSGYVDAVVDGVEELSEVATKLAGEDA
jgi:methanogenic corrinoid protein MtbC1